MTTPHDEAEATFIGPPRQPTEAELSAQLTVRIPWQHPSKRRSRQHAPLAVAASVGTGLAALTGIVAVIALVLLGKITLGQTPDGGELPVALAVWLLAHGVPLQTGIGDFALAPLSLALLAFWRLNRAGIHATRGIGARGSGSVRQALLVATSIATGYAVIGLVASFLISRPGLELQPWRAGVHLFVCGFVAGLAGALRATGAVREIARAAPQLVRDALRTGAVACLLLVGAGAGAGGLAIALSGSDAVHLFSSFPSGLAGQAGVTVVCLAFAPNMAMWATAYLLGPGFVVGPGILVSPGKLTHAPDGVAQALPPLPALAGLPETELHGPLWIIMALPLLAGVVASLLLVRRRLRPRRTRAGDTVVPVPHWLRMLGSAVLAGPVAGLVVGAATFAAAGNLDGGAAFPLGAVPWQVALAATAAVALGSCVGIAAAFLKAQLAHRPD
jgi:hypothetical protein